MQPPDSFEAKTHEIKAWLEKSERDLQTARHLLTANPPLTDSSVFHCQQAAEKAIKAFLAWHDKPFKKTHVIAEIGGQAISIDETLEALVLRAMYLTPYATVFRYPGEVDLPSMTEVEDAIKVAEEVYLSILQRLPKETHPMDIS